MCCFYSTRGTPMRPILTPQDNQMLDKTVICRNVYRIQRTCVHKSTQKVNPFARDDTSLSKPDLPTDNARNQKTHSHRSAAGLP